MWRSLTWKQQQHSCVAGKVNSLGIPIGCNQRKKHVWNPILAKMQNRMSTWKGWMLSIGGMITLINTVINAMPIHFLSFYKIPKAVLKEMVKIQKEFLWGGGDEKKEICWVSWEEV